MAKGTDTAKSDIDLMIIGEDISYADIFMALQNAEKNLHRPINPNLMTADEWRKRRSNKSAFVTKIARAAKNVRHWEQTMSSKELDNLVRVAY